jgi:uncharacterized protein YdaU (DUF1376 family)
MAKDPAFLFYSSDFLSGVSDLTMEERGQYITLLCLQHQKGGKLSRKAMAIAVPNAAADVMAKFKEDEDGMFSNERLVKECIKRKEHSEKQRQRALDGWKKRKSEKDTAADATALPLESENENEIINTFKPSIEDIKKYTIEKGYEVDANKIWHYYNDNDWCDAKGNKVVRWKTKILNNWCKEENKVKPKYSGAQRFKVKYRNDTRTHIHTEAEIIIHSKKMLSEAYQTTPYND